MKKFTATQLKNNLGDVLNAAQEDGFVRIESKSRPDFIIMASTGVECTGNGDITFADDGRVYVRDVDFSKNVDRKSFFSVIERLIELKNKWVIYYSKNHKNYKEKCTHDHFEPSDKGQ